MAAIRILFLTFWLLFASLININCFRKPNFQTYWNIPTFQCKSHQIDFTQLALKFGITQNANDEFRGEEITILYDPGAFPAMLHNPDTSRIIFRNGGVPQNGNLTMHLDLFRETVESLIPDKDFQGIGVIDFESWRPIYRQNFGNLQPYKEFSVKIEREKHPHWTHKRLEDEARMHFERYARIFMEETLLYAQKLRPSASWGYYSYPFCFNMSPNNRDTHCREDVIRENDRLEWLFHTVNNIHPSLYLNERSLTSHERMQYIVGRITETKRIVKHLNTLEVPRTLPYFWYKYQDSRKFLSKEDVNGLFRTLLPYQVDGLVLWGSSNDVNTKEKCYELYQFVEHILGPALSVLIQ